MADFDTDASAEIARAHNEWTATGSGEARNHLFALIDAWVRKQAHYMLIRRFGGAPRSVNTATFAQDVLTKLLTSLHRIDFRGVPQLLGYILGAMRSYLVDLARKNHAQEVPLSDTIVKGAADAFSAVNLEFAPGTRNVTIVGGDFSTLVVVLRIFEKIEQVHPLHGLVFQLKELAGFQRSEIAGHLGIPDEEVDKILRKVRTKFRYEWNKATHNQENNTD